MEALECIKTRRSVRKFKEDIIPDEVIRELVELGRIHRQFVTSVFLIRRRSRRSQKRV